MDRRESFAAGAKKGPTASRISFELFPAKEGGTRLNSVANVSKAKISRLVGLSKLGVFIGDDSLCLNQLRDQTRSHLGGSVLQGGIRFGLLVDSNSKFPIGQVWLARLYLVAETIAVLVWRLRTSPGSFAIQRVVELYLVTPPSLQSFGVLVFCQHASNSSQIALCKASAIRFD